jgi:hypothetical protein
MKEGWAGDVYLILFDEAEVANLSELYGFSEMLPGYHLLGLRGWDDFIVQNSEERIFSVPTIPLDAKYLTPVAIPMRHDNLHPDARFREKIKWYVKPIAFGGDPGLAENLAWISLQEHARLVRWWNNLYRSAKNTPEIKPDA